MDNKDYKAFREGNPVLIQTSIRYIRELKGEDQDAIKGYSFQADGNVTQHVEPYPIDGDFLRVYDHLKRFDGDDFFCFPKEYCDSRSTYTFSWMCIEILSPKTGMCNLEN